jgi:hypothetical protein
MVLFGALLLFAGMAVVLELKRSRTDLDSVILYNISANFFGLAFILYPSLSTIHMVICAMIITVIELGIMQIIISGRAFGIECSRMKIYRRWKGGIWVVMYDDNKWHHANAKGFVSGGGCHYTFLGNKKVEIYDPIVDQEKFAKVAEEGVPQIVTWNVREMPVVGGITASWVPPSRISFFADGIDLVINGDGTITWNEEKASSDEAALVFLESLKKLAPEFFRQSKL